MKTHTFRTYYIFILIFTCAKQTHKQVQPSNYPAHSTGKSQVPVKQEKKFPIVTSLTSCGNKLGIKIREEIKSDNGNSLGEGE